MGQSAPPVDYKGIQTGITNAADTQLKNNRLNTSSPFASQTFNPDGSTSTQFTGGLGDAANGLVSQAGQMSKPMDWGQFGQAGTGDSARDQAVTGAYNQATSRLDPQWDHREEMMRARLQNQGLDPASAGFQTEANQFGQQRNDAYSSAMNGAIQQGTAAGDSAFRNNMMSRQQAIGEALQQRGMPMQELQKLQGLLGQPGYNVDGSTLSGALGGAPYGTKAAEQTRDDWLRQQAQNTDAAAGIMGGIGSIAGAAAMFF